jgi:hypothetical protein
VSGVSVVSQPIGVIGSVSMGIRLTIPTRASVGRSACGTRCLYIAGLLGRRRVVRSKTPGAAVVSDEAVKLTDVLEEISELISEIGERYGIGSPIMARRLTGGYANDSSGSTPTARARFCTSSTHRAAFQCP